MLKIDYWYKSTKADDIRVWFYPNDGMYRGNLYKDGKAIADFYADNSVEIETRFHRLMRR